MLEELKLPEYGGQHCDARIVKRNDQDIYVWFSSDEDYGGPCLDICKVRELLRKMEAMVDTPSDTNVNPNPADADLLAVCKAAFDHATADTNARLDIFQLKQLEAAIAKAENTE